MNNKKKTKTDYKANTTSSLYVKNTIMNPNVKSIIQSVSTIIQSQILEDFQNNYEKKKSRHPDRNWGQNPKGTRQGVNGQTHGQRRDQQRSGNFNNEKSYHNGQTAKSGNQKTETGDLEHGKNFSQYQDGYQKGSKRPKQNHDWQERVQSKEREIDQYHQDEEPYEDAYWDFNEEKYMQRKPKEFSQKRKNLLRKMPKIKNIYKFIKVLYDIAQFSPECNIISLVYINRLINFYNLNLHPTNWRPLILVALLVAQKVWDDRYLCTADFAQIYPFFNKEELIQLEIKFLQLIEYNVQIKGSTYAKYYFELRGLFKINDEKDFPLQPLTQQEAYRLELNSQNYQNPNFQNGHAETPKGVHYTGNYNQQQNWQKPLKKFNSKTPNKLKNKQWKSNNNVHSKNRPKKNSNPQKSNRKESSQQSFFGSQMKSSNISSQGGVNVVQPSHLSQTDIMHNKQKVIKQKRYTLS